MKKLAFALFASLLILSACGNKTSKEGTHTHDDGSTHADHQQDTTQQEFNAADTTGHVHDSTTHVHH
jgi:protein involved in sex pheromone biosynthesis